MNFGVVFMGKGKDSRVKSSSQRMEEDSFDLLFISKVMMTFLLRSCLVEPGLYMLLTIFGEEVGIWATLFCFTIFYKIILKFSSINLSKLQKKNKENKFIKKHKKNLKEDATRLQQENKKKKKKKNRTSIDV